MVDESGARSEIGTVQVIDKKGVKTMPKKDYLRRGEEGVRKARRKRKRKVGRRKLGVTTGLVGAITTATALSIACSKDNSQEAINNAAVNEFSSRAPITDILKNQEDKLTTFKPGTTAVDLTKARFRSSTEIINMKSYERTNIVDIFDYRLSNGQIIPKDSLTLLIENAVTIDAANPANGHVIPIDVMDKDGKTTVIYTSFDGLGVKEQGIVASEADKTHKTGFIEKNDNALYAFIPEGNNPSTTVKTSDLNQISFSAQPITQVLP